MMKQVCGKFFGWVALFLIGQMLFGDAKAVEVVRERNAITRIVFPMIDTAKGELVIGDAANLTVLYSEWNDVTNPTTFSAMDGTVAEIGTKSGIYYLALIATEVDLEYTAIRCTSSTGGVMSQVILIRTVIGDPANAATTTTGGEINVASGIVESDVTKWKTGTVATVDAAGYPKVTIKDGTSQGELLIDNGATAIDWANVINKSSTVNLSTTTILRANNVDALAIGSIVPTVLATNAITASNLHQNAVDKIAYAIWNMAHDTSVSFQDSSFGEQWHSDNWGAVATGFSTHTAANVTDDWESQSLSDPTGFRVNVMEWIGTGVTLGAGGAPDVNIESVDAAAIEAGDIAADGIGATELAANAIGASELAADAVDEIADNVLQRTRGAFAGTPTTTTGAVTALTQADDYWNDNMIVFIEGTAIGQVARISDFTATTDLITWAPALTVAPAAGDSFAIVGIFATVPITSSTIADNVWDEVRSDHVTNNTFGSNFATDSADLKAVKTTTDKFVFGATNVVNANVTHYEGDPDVDAKIEAQVVDALTAQDVMLASDSTTFADHIWSHGTRTLTAGAGTDSATTSRIIGRKVWGIPAGASGSSDSTAIADRLVDTTFNSPGATATLSAANMGSISDSVWAKDTSNVLWDTKLNTFGNWNAQAQAATSSTDCECGGGAQTDSILVLDTSGTPVAVANVKVTIKSQSTGAIVAWAVTNGAGYVIVYLDVSTAYTAAGQATSGYFFPPYNFTTGSGATYLDTLKGFNIEAVSTSLAQQTTLTGTAKWGSTILGGAKVHVTLAGSKEFYTTTDLVPATTIIVIADPTTGVWSLNVYGTDSLSAPGTASASYNVRIDHPLLSKSGIIIEYGELLIPADSSAVTQLRTIIAGKN